MVLCQHVAVFSLLFKDFGIKTSVRVVESKKMQPKHVIRMDTQTWLVMLILKMSALQDPVKCSAPWRVPLHSFTVSYYNNIQHVPLADFIGLVILHLFLSRIFFFFFYLFRVSQKSKLLQVQSNKPCHVKSQDIYSQSCSNEVSLHRMHSLNQTLLWTIVKREGLQYMCQCGSFDLSSTRFSCQQPYFYMMICLYLQHSLKRNGSLLSL